MRFDIKALVLLSILFLGCDTVCSAVSLTHYVSHQEIEGGFALAEKTALARLYVDSQDDLGVLRAIGDLQRDMERVTGQAPQIVHSKKGLGPCAVIIGTIGDSELVDHLVEKGKIDISAVSGKWESFLIQVVSEPIEGVSSGLVIAGSDRRGTLYGIYDLCEQIGVSPWTWWADVPVKRQTSLYIKPNPVVCGPPAVKYRGIFLNDEEPALGRWAVENYGGFNHQFYEKVFELILRLKGNYLWPAMWWASFCSDDPLNPKLADEYGIVIGTTHHEPMMRAHAEWKKAKGGAWNYETNAETLRQFWTEGIERMGQRESIVTLAMRGDGDMAMSQDTNIALLEKIVADQRQILAETTGKDVTAIPQLWALYKEVQDYYDKGMRVPDDVTLLLCDDNWGNVRRLPKPDAPPRAGGYGMYYHFDYVGGPRNYKWLNTSPLARVWEQMHLCYRHGVDRIWLVNVGDLKPMEYPISFFLDYAWDPEAWPAHRLPKYARLWAAQQFGDEHANAIAEILTAYTRFNGRRKPEMLAPNLYSLTHYREAETVVADYNRLAEKAAQLARQLPPRYQDAYFQLVLHPVIACANLNELHVTVGRNHLYAQQGRAATNDLAQKVANLFRRDQDISDYYNKTLAGGKWNHMMDQTHISYTSWQQPSEDVLPEVKRINVPQDADMGVTIEGSDDWWPSSAEPAVLPTFDAYNRPTRFIEVFNRGQTPFRMEVDCGVSWVKVSPHQASIKDELRLQVSIDWKNVPHGTQNVPITIKGPGDQRVTIRTVVENPVAPARHKIEGFVEADGYVCMEAEHYAHAVQNSQVQWQRIPDMGRTLSGMMPIPVTAPSQAPGADSPRLEYRMHLFSIGPVKVHAYFCPTQNYLGSEGLRYAVSIDDEAPQIVNVHENETVPDWKYPAHWNKAVSENIKILTSQHQIAKPGPHVLKFWRVDPGLVLQRLVVDTGGLQPSYLGPPESHRGGLAGAFATGQYRNLFAEAGYKPDVISRKVEAAYKQLFHGNPETEALYYAVGENEHGALAQIRDIHSRDVRSEGMSYGMMIAVQLDRKAEFDALWNWAKTFMYHDDPAHPAYGYFSWSMKADGKANDEMPAPDGEEYFATALYFAGHRWGNGLGIYDYQAEAQLDKISISNDLHTPQGVGGNAGIHAVEVVPAESIDSPRQRISINSGWRFMKYETAEEADHLIYDVRPEVKKRRQIILGEDEATAAVAVEVKKPVMKPWILPTGNEFVSDVSKHHARPKGHPGKDFPYVQTAFDDHAWETVDLPHDWAIKGPFCEGWNAPVSGGMGRLPSPGVAWYRKTLDIPATDAGKSIFLDIDGAMSYAMVWLNGTLVGGWPYGYNAWRVDLTPYVRPGQVNQLAIRLDNPNDSSRWYPGGGIYRNVWLVKVSPVHVAHWGTCVTTAQVSEVQATVNLDVTVDNDSTQDAKVEVMTQLYALDKDENPEGKAVATIRPVSVSIGASAKAAVNGSAIVRNPRLWGPPPQQTPHRYVAVTEVTVNGQVVDQVETPFGIRSLGFDGDEGLLVNGERIFIKGVNLHHDHGALGGAFNLRAAQRQLEILQAMGCNAIRTAHNPFAPEFYELTDQMGFLVMDEVFDVWNFKKPDLDFHLVFPEWHEQDLRSMIRRDRNHPSIIMWSFGNEVGEQYRGAREAETARMLYEIAKDEDPTRPATSAMNVAKPDSAFAQVSDVISLNYQGEGLRWDGPYAKFKGNKSAPQYQPFHDKFPDRLILSSENACVFTSRGEYFFPVYEGISAPFHDMEGAADMKRAHVSAYELYTEQFGSSADKVFAAQEKHPFVAGGFVWTGWDYLGEPSPFYQSRSSYYGIVDLAGFPKNKYYLYQSHWRPDLPMAHILPHWNWPERVGEVTPVHVFTSGDEAELFLNGKSVGRKKKGAFEYRLRWDNVKYEPGVLRVVSFKDGRFWAHDTVRTTGPAAGLEASVDREAILADGQDLAFVTVRVLDADGLVCPRANPLIEFRVEGPGQIVATDNGDPTDMTPFPSHERKAFNGLALVIVKAKPEQTGKITLTAKSEGLTMASATIDCR